MITTTVVKFETFFEISDMTHVENQFFVKKFQKNIF